MAKTYRDGQMITGNAVDKRKVPLGTVIRYEPGGDYRGRCSVLTPGGWVLQSGRVNQVRYSSTEKLFRILHVGDGDGD
jgi:hypothetical protein